MRSTCGNARWLLNDQRELEGISLGADATTEHEIGSAGIAQKFGYSYAARSGVGARKFATLPTRYGLEDVVVDGSPALLMSSDISRAKGLMKAELRFWQSISGQVFDTAAAWDDQNFAILSRGPDMTLLRQLDEAMRKHDAMAGGLLSARHKRVGGLVFAIFSRVPTDLLTQTQVALDEEVERDQILKESGVHDAIKAAGFSYFSLKATIWADETKKSIRIWLNPREQNKFNCGWFTLGELFQWAKNEGPVLKTKN